VITDPFQGLAARFAVTLGMPAYPVTMVPHPVSTLDDAALDELADRAAGGVAARLGASER
jgi:hypothetical protein